jgi:hypothetical protein
MTLLIRPIILLDRAENYNDARFPRPSTRSRAGARMKIIHVKPSKKFKSAWVAFEAQGSNRRLQRPMQGAKHRLCLRTLRRSAGEVHVHDESGENHRTQHRHRRSGYPQGVCD